MLKIEGNTFDEIAKKTCNECKENSIENLIIIGHLKYEEVTNSQLIRNYYEKAEKWQKEKKPNELYINHGQYINKAGNAKEFLINELRRKKHSNRACLSLINMEDILNSGDDPIPSFMVLQFGFSPKDHNLLIVHAYFRALEVSCFLPINLAEICIYIKYFKNSFPEINEIDLVISVFRAQCIPNFYCLEKPKFDTVGPIKITKAVLENNKNILLDLIDSKLSIEESKIDYSGFQYLYDAFKEKTEDRNNEIILEKIEELITILKEIEELRKCTSIYNDDIKNKSNEYQERLKTLRDLLEKLL